ncbi:hypothetical protein DFP94_10138 [Fontibacillus phaseoli]|uniref:Uncharacterized protein n=1 Tax=Fontibacillus phaseoli TaxID=1416533 RepID=A0A369BP96_9BACL|nr:hypothetical protein DFP94_10138 [Fontibacillus phaseoli]
MTISFINCVCKGRLSNIWIEGTALLQQKSRFRNFL